MGRYGTLIPSIERRLTTWTALQDQLERQPAACSRPTITISRSFGCEGFPLAEELQRRFEAGSGEAWGLYDKALLEKIAHDEHLSLAYLSNFDLATPFGEMLGAFLPSYRSLDGACALVVQHILRVACHGNAIIVGRGSAIICYKLPNCFHFRLEASFSFRASSIAHRLGISLAEAERMVRNGEKMRDRFISDYLGVKVSDHTHYDAVFNNDRHSIQVIAAAIVGYVRGAQAAAQAAAQPAAQPAAHPGAHAALHG
jgi:hypothetical protein